MPAAPRSDDGADIGPDPDRLQRLAPDRARAVVEFGIEQQIDALADHAHQHGGNLHGRLIIMAEKNVPCARAYADANEFDCRPQRAPMGVGVAQSDFGEMLPSLRLPIIGRACRVQFDAENVVARHGARHGIAAVNVGRAEILPEEHNASHGYFSVCRGLKQAPAVWRKAPEWFQSAQRSR